MCSAAFLAGATLSGRFYRDAVRPLLSGYGHAAALLGWGSDVLGYDDERSVDHGWGPRVLLFLRHRDDAEDVERILDSGLPDEYAGWPVRFGWDDVAAGHHVTVATLRDWLVAFLGIEDVAEMTNLDWLLTPQQRLLGVVAGAVFADDDGVLAAVRATLAWYPDQVWRWLLACQWHRLAQEEAFVARTAEVGDATGSAVVAGRLVRDMMRLALLLDRRYAPYTKWLGTAFTRVPSSDGLAESLARALRASDSRGREEALASAWTALGHRHNSSALTAPVPVSIGSYHSRPAHVLMADRFTEALLATVSDPLLSALPPIGAVDQIVDNSDVLTTPALYRRLASLYSAAE